MKNAKKWDIPPLKEEIVSFNEDTLLAVEIHLLYKEIFMSYRSLSSLKNISKKFSTKFLNMSLEVPKACTRFKNAPGFQQLCISKEHVSNFSMPLFYGYASVFDVVDAQGERIKRGAFAESLLYYQKCGTAPPMFYEHEHNNAIGHWLKMHEDKHGLWVEGTLDQEHSDYHAFFQKFMMTDFFSLSIGFDILESYFEKSCHTIEKLHLFEISLVSHPANPLTKACCFQDI